MTASAIVVCTDSVVSLLTHPDRLITGDHSGLIAGIISPLVTDDDDDDDGESPPIVQVNQFPSFLKYSSKHFSSSYYSSFSCNSISTPHARCPSR